MTTLSTEVEAVISAYTDWLNALPPEFGEKLEVTRDMYDEWDDAPVVLVETELGSNKLIVVSVSPFHDEGGHTLLIGIFHDYGGKGWNLYHVVGEFDVSLMTIMDDGKLQVRDE